MRHLVTMVFVTTVFLSISHLSIGQGQGRRGRHKSPVQLSMRDIQERPQMGIEYSRTAELKLSSRKSSYRFG